ncbi:MAG: prolyl oligopeptidase [Patescibacteria group bacterium]|nr:prolyl oligopeptidase [Patescibacteria group bacterium]
MMAQISFTSDDDKVAGNLLTAQHPSPFAFLFIQGWTGRQNLDAAQALVDLGCTSMTYDMRGNKTSKGDLAKLSRADFLKDAVIAYDFLKQQVGQDVAIGVVGGSFGAYTGALLSERRQVAYLSLHVPANYPDEGFNDPQQPQASSEALTAWHNTIVEIADNKALTALHNYHSPIQIIEAENDEYIPHQSTLNYVNAVADKDQLEYVVMKGASHRLETDELLAGYKRLLTEWVQKHG